MFNITAMVMFVNDERINQVEESFYTLFNEIEDFLFIIDEAGNILNANRYATHKSEYALEELCAMNLFRLQAPADQDESLGMLKDILDGKISRSLAPLRTKDGRDIAVETRMFRGKWADQDVIFVISKDISARLGAQDHFIRSFKGNPSLMFISSISTGQCLDVNENFLTTLGYERSDVIGKTPEELDLFADNNFREVFLQQLSTYGYARNLELKIRGKDERVITGLYSADIIEIGNDQYLLASLNDITEQKWVELALKESESLLRKSQEAAHIGSFVADFIDRTVESSGVLGMLFGLDQYPCTFKEWLDLIHPDWQAGIREHFIFVSTERRRFDYEFKIIRGSDGMKDGCTAWESLNMILHLCPFA